MRLSSLKLKNHLLLHFIKSYFNQAREDKTIPIAPIV